MTKLETQDYPTSGVVEKGVGGGGSAIPEGMGSGGSVFSDEAVRRLVERLISTF